MKDELARQIQDEGYDWVSTVIHVAVIVSLLFAATFCHAKASRAQAIDPMPILQLDNLFIPQVTK